MTSADADRARLRDFYLQQFEYINCLFTNQTILGLLEYVEKGGSNPVVRADYAKAVGCALLRLKKYVEEIEGVPPAQACSSFSFVTLKKKTK